MSLPLLVSAYKTHQSASVRFAGEAICRITYCTLPCMKGKSVELPLIVSRAFSTTRGMVFALVTTPRVRLTFFLHRAEWIRVSGLTYRCSVKQSALHTRDFDRQPAQAGCRYSGGRLEVAHCGSLNHLLANWRARRYQVIRDWSADRSLYL